MKTYNYIYLITNTLNGKIYVGKHSTDNLNDGYMGSGKLLKLAFNKYGIENFTKKILHFAETEEELNDLEIFYIKDLDAKTKGYNLTDGGDGKLGYEHSDETKRKMSESSKGKSMSEEARKKMSETRKGRTPWNKGKAGLQQAWNKGKVGVSRGWNKGKPRSEETKRKISETLRRKKEAI